MTSRLVPEDFASKSWRLTSISSLLTTPWAVERLRFFSDVACMTEITDEGKWSASSTGSGQGPEHVQEADNTYWNSTCTEFCCGTWIGVDYPEPHEVRCALLDLPPNTEEAPLALQVWKDGNWVNVATVPGRGGATSSWSPLELGASCQGIAALGPDVRGFGGTIWMLEPKGAENGQRRLQIEELRYYSDKECSNDITGQGIPMETVVWGGVWKAGQVSGPAARSAFGYEDGEQGDAPWTAKSLWGNWTGSVAHNTPSIGLALPDTMQVECVKLVQPNFAHNMRLLKCDGGPTASWVGVDDCVCHSSWDNHANGNFPTTVPGFRLVPVVMVFLFAALGTAALLFWTFSSVQSRWGIWLQLRSMLVALTTKKKRTKSRSTSFKEKNMDERLPFLRDAPVIAEPSPTSTAITMSASPTAGGVLRVGDLEPLDPMHEQFKHQAKKYPKAIALRFRERDYTYHSLSHSAHELASALRSIVQPRSVVGLLLDRSPAMIVAFLGSLEAGLVWVPLDERAPVQRLRSMLEDTCAACVFVDEGFDESRGADIGLPLLKLTSEGKLLDRSSLVSKPAIPPPLQLQAHDTACLYFTSGSTGQPKAVVMDQRFFVANAVWYVESFDVQPGSIVAAKARFIWATALWEVLPPLIAGAKLLLLPKLKTEEVVFALAENGVTHLTGVPSELELIVEPDLALRHVICMGERLMLPVAERLVTRLPALCKLWNAYAATESPVSLWQYLPGSDKVLAGRPLRGSFIGILDEEGEIQDVGEVGEIVMGGVIPRCGYWKREETTAERFTQTAVGFGYRTGDLGRFVVTSDGSSQLEVTGRKDRQVKIRGQRVELGEIETVVSQLLPEPSNKAVVLAPRTEDSQQHLFLLATPESVELVSLREGLVKRLPEYMVPDRERMRALASFPYLPNGKVNMSELNELATKHLVEEPQETLDSLGLARRYSKQHLAMKNSIDTASGLFLIGMLLYHNQWWAYGAHPISTCVACSPFWLAHFLQSAVVNETCLFGFVCGSALMATTQADLNTFSRRDIATFSIYLFMYLPWSFISTWLSFFFPELFVRHRIQSYSRWFLLMVLFSKVLLVVTRRTKVWPSVMCLLILGSFLCFPESGRIHLPIQGTCQHPGDAFAFMGCLFLPHVVQPILVERKFIPPIFLYYAIACYGPLVTKASPAKIACLRPSSLAARGAVAAALLAGIAGAGYWYTNLVYPAAGYETVEWPDAPVQAGNPKIDNMQAVVMLILAIGVPVFQVALLFVAVYIAPGDQLKERVAGLVSSTMLGTYLISTSNINSTQWVLRVVLYVCDCQCSAVESLAQLVGVVSLLIALYLVLGTAFQALLLRVMVPLVFKVGDTLLDFASRKWGRRKGEAGSSSSDEDSLTQSQGSSSSRTE